MAPLVLGPNTAKSILSPLYKLFVCLFIPLKIQNCVTFTPLILRAPTICEQQWSTARWLMGPQKDRFVHCCCCCCLACFVYLFCNCVIGNCPSQNGITLHDARSHYLIFVHLYLRGWTKMLLNLQAKLNLVPRNHNLTCSTILRPTFNLKPDVKLPLPLHTHKHTENYSATCSSIHLI